MHLSQLEYVFLKLFKSAATSRRCHDRVDMSLRSVCVLSGLCVLSSACEEFRWCIASTVVPPNIASVV